MHGERVRVDDWAKENWEKLCLGFGILRNGMGLSSHLAQNLP